MRSSPSVPDPAWPLWNLADHESPSIHWGRHLFSLPSASGRIATDFQVTSSSARKFAGTISSGLSTSHLLCPSRQYVAPHDPWPHQRWCTLPWALPPHTSHFQLGQLRSLLFSRRSAWCDTCLEWTRSWPSRLRSWKPCPVYLDLLAYSLPFCCSSSDSSESFYFPPRSPRFDSLWVLISFLEIPPPWFCPVRYCSDHNTPPGSLRKLSATSYSSATWRTEPLGSAQSWQRQNLHLLATMSILPD